MFFFLKALHLVGIVLLAGALFGQIFLLSQKNGLAFRVLEDLKRWTGITCYAGLILVLVTGLYMGFSTSLFYSEDDFWLRYKSGGVIVFILLILRQQQVLHKIIGKPGSRQLAASQRGRGLWTFIVLLFGVFLYISVAKPYLFNNPSIIFEQIQSASSEVEEIEDVEEIEE